MNSIAKLLRLDGRTAVVTGGAGHIGKAACAVFSELGARVVVVDVDQAACDARAEWLRSEWRGEAIGVGVDLASRESAALVVDATIAAFGGIDILVHNAAFTGASALAGYAVPLEQQTLEAWDAAMEVNLTAAFHLTQHARPALEKSGRGSIVHVSSIYGVVGPNMSLYEGTSMGNPAAYAATKGALVQLTRYMATVLAPKIRVNSVSPGGIARGQPSTFVERYCRLTPMQRMGTEEDLKGAFAYLASDLSAYVTGQNIAVDGGWTSW
jgi:NAD(P)-dependent dehydrogenase (short-subunit alcohol dehydrogenase family)